MPKIIELDSKYSTTRYVIRDKSKKLSKKVELFDKFEDKNKNVLFRSDGKVRDGGLRKRGYFKIALNNKPLITVVTVVYNGEQLLEETILSVINQTYNNVEYIIIDGGSSDGTHEIISKYEHAINYWISEPDSGIYDAMNKGIDLVQGDWINFMNCGDKFTSSEILFKIFNQKNPITAQIIYGNHEVQYPSGRIRYVKAGNIKNLWKGSQFCHQASFVNSSFHKMFKFNEGTKIIADFEFFYNALNNNATFKYVDLNIANFRSGGISDLKRIESILGFWQKVEKSNLINFYYIFKILKEIVKSYIKKLHITFRFN